jgi:hypothetical protein
MQITIKMEDSKMSNENINDFNRKAQSDNSITNSFTKDHLKIASKAFESIRNSWANGVLNDDFEFIKLSTKNPELVETNLINFDTVKNQQGYRVSGRSPSINDVKRSIQEQGYKLNKEMPVLYKNPDGTYDIITGNTRYWVLEQFNFTNLIAYVYEGISNSNTKGIELDKRELSVVLNPAEDPSEPASMEDVIQYGLAVCNAKVIDVNSPSAFDQIKKKIARSTFAIQLSESKVSYCVATIMNRADGYAGEEIVPLNNVEANKWVHDAKFKNIPNKVRYIVKSYDMVRANVVEAIQEAAQFPNEEVRLIIHGGILGGNPGSTWENRVTKFWYKKNEILNDFQQVIFGGKTKDIQNFVLYGAIPQVESMHDLNKLVLFNQRNGSLYQK